MEPLKQQSPRPIFLSWKNKSIDFIKAYQEQNIPLMLSYCSPNCIIEFIPLGDQGKGSVFHVGQSIWTSLIESFPSIDNTVNTVIDEKENVRCEVTIWGKQEKDFAGLVSKGNEFEEDHIFIFKINEANLIEHISVDWDHDSFVRQLS